jgi:hypothetical protein
MGLFTLFSTPANAIGELIIPATLEENHNDSLTITEHPVEFGAPITDHSYKNPPELIMRCGWTNSSFAAIKAIFSSLLADGDLPGDNYIDSIYFKLLKMQEDRLPITVQSTKRWYKNMMITGLQVTTDDKTSNILLIVITLKKINIVKTQATVLPPKENQKNAADTSSPTSSGQKQLVAK